jgi:4-hydroxy-4-methyl-2-oxoglutarate aldolase
MDKNLKLEQIETLKKFNTSTISDTFDELGIEGTMHDLKPIVSGKTIVGPAVTVCERPVLPCPEKLAIGEVIEGCELGDVIVIDAGNAPYIAAWGGLVSIKAKAKGVAGIVVDGAVRDITEIREYEMPTWAKYVTPISAVKRYKIISINETVVCGDVLVNAGDLIISDEDGVCCIPYEKLDEVIEVASKLYEWEQEVLSEFKKGRSEAIKKRVV